MDAKKASAYIRYKKNAMSMTFRQIEESSGVSDSTAQAYFAGTVKTMKPDTFLYLAAAMGRKHGGFQSVGAGRHGARCADFERR